MKKKYKQTSKQSSKQGLTQKYSLEHAVIWTEMFWSQAYLRASHFREFKEVLLASNWCKIKVSLFHFNEWSKIIYHSIHRPKVSASCTSSTGRNREKKKKKENTTLASWKINPLCTRGLPHSHTNKAFKEISGRKPLKADQIIRLTAT